jgi:DegV family protein with EDD domain
MIAAAECKNVYAVDSRNLSTGTGHLVIEAARMAEKGLFAKEIAAEVKTLTDKVCASFIIDTLDYLHKGGRCSSVAALGANLLKLKPCIEVKNGLMEVGKKYKGNLPNVLVDYVTAKLAGRDDIRKDRIFITHTGCSSEIVQRVTDKIKSLQTFDEILETTAGCTITSHCGPNTLGILFMTK